MVAGTAQAQSSVTVYGIVDMGYGSKDYTNNNYVAGANGSTSGTQNGSLSSQRLGFRGTEDLGGGLKANFVMESTAGADTNFASDREYRVGLSSASLGSLEVGKSKTVNQLMMERYTAGGANNWVGEAWNYSDSTSFNTQAVPAYGSTAAVNAVNRAAATTRPVEAFTGSRVTGFHYNSPNMSGVQVGVTIATAENKDEEGAASNNAKSNNQEFAIVYTGIKGLSLGASMGEQKVRAATATAETKGEVTQFGGSYVFGPATVFAQYIDSQLKGTNGAQTRAIDGTQFGVRFAVNPKVTLHAQMAQMDEESTAGVKSHDRDAMQLGAQYALSKRTTAYVLYGTQEAKNVSTGVTNEIKGTVAGVRHSF
jgi:predicted porin